MKLQSLQIDFSQGIDNPPQISAGLPSGFTLRPTTKPWINQEVSSGKMSYAQSINVQNDKYGKEILLPGPYINPFTQSSTLPIYMEAVDPTPNGQMIWYAIGNGNTFNAISGIAPGQTPAINLYLGNPVTVTLSTTTGPGAMDMASGRFQGGAAMAMYVSMATNTGAGGVLNYLGYFQSSDNTVLTNRLYPLSSPNPSLPATGLPAPLPMIRTKFDQNIYIGNTQFIDMLNTAGATFSSSILQKEVGTLEGLGKAIPYPWNFTAMGEWNGLLVGAANNEAPSDFSMRNGTGQSQIYFWDLVNAPAANYQPKFINSPSHYISVLKSDLSGNLLAFGGVDEGRTTIYQYNGYGFDSIFSYIGDMPRNEHSVCFDSVGRIVWVTTEARLCRYDRVNDIFDNLGVVGGNPQNGGICTNLQYSAPQKSFANPIGYDFLVAADQWLSAVQLNAFHAGGATDDVLGQPLAISGLQVLPQNSIITNVNVGLQKALETGEKIEVRLYPSNYVYASASGSAFTILGNLDYAVDGTITAKNIRSLQTGQTSFAIGYAWLTTATDTAPGVVSTRADFYQITTP